MEYLLKKYIPKMVMITMASPGKLIAALLILFTFGLSFSYATDNPDAPDLIGEFKARSKIHLDAINKPDNTNRAYLIAYDNYRNFLDEELNKAYQLLLTKLSAERKAELKASQQNWLKFRDAEFIFIEKNWTREAFGSSAGMSRGAYRCSIIKSRIIELLNYAKNY